MNPPSYLKLAVNAAIGLFFNYIMSLLIAPFILGMGGLMILGIMIIFSSNLSAIDSSPLIKVILGILDPDVLFKVYFWASWIVLAILVVIERVFSINYGLVLRKAALYSIVAIIILCAVLYLKVALTIPKEERGFYNALILMFGALASGNLLVDYLIFKSISAAESKATEKL